MDFQDSGIDNSTLEPDQRGWGAQVLWHAASFILPVFSLDFYRIALSRKLSRSLTFFVVFATTLSALFTLKAVRIVTELDTEITSALAGGDFPVISIQDGVASVDASQPVVILDQRGQLFVLDTSGEYTDIDPGRYREGILLTRNELIVLDSSGQRQSLSLSELNSLFGTNPIIIDEAFVLEAWADFSRIAVGFAGLGLWIWHSLVRLMLLAFVGLLIWGTVSVLRSQMDFRSIMIVGFYALVPALYFHYLLGRIGIAWPGLQTMILMIIWMGASIAAVTRADRSIAGQERMLLQMTPIGVPMLLVLAWDVIFTPAIEPLELWAVPILTFIAWFVMRRFRYEEDQPTAGQE